MISACELATTRGSQSHTWCRLSTSRSSTAWQSLCTEPEEHNAPSSINSHKNPNTTAMPSGIRAMRLRGFFWIYFLNNLTIIPPPVWDASFILFLHRGSNNTLTLRYLFLMFYCLRWPCPADCSHSLQAGWYLLFTLFPSELLTKVMKPIFAVLFFGQKSGENKDLETII